MKVGQAFPSKYLSAADLEGHARKVIISHYNIEEIGEEGDKREKPVLYFEGKKKALVLNVTNANMIAEVLGSDELDDWVNKEIELLPARVEFKGKIVDAIRVKDNRVAPPADDGDDVPF